MCLAIPGKVLEQFEKNGMLMAKVQFGGIVREACLDYVPEAKVGDYVLVHVGFAISTVDAEEAARTYELLEQMDQLTELDAPVVDERSKEAAMKYVDEYRNAKLAQAITSEIRHIQTQPWVIMEVCGGQTHSIVKHGIDRLLPEGVELVHGPGCPVCVTPLETIDKAHAIAARPGVIFCSFGDMLRVPGSHGDLFTLKSQGADVRVVYSPLDCLKIARANPEKSIVFFAIGFETTAPANAMLVFRAKQQALNNVSALVSHSLVPPAIAFILDSPQNRVQGFLGPGHVCAIMGYREYEPLSELYKVPIVITGFEPLDLLQGTLMTVRQLEARKAAVQNQYSRVLNREGNAAARKLVDSVFEVSDRKWRGVGSIPNSGYKLRKEYRDHDAEYIFKVNEIDTNEPEICISGQILRGIKKPHDCTAFGTLCTPLTPLGATMVSAEGACAAYYAYGRHLDRKPSGAGLTQIGGAA